MKKRTIKIKLIETAETRVKSADWTRPSIRRNKIETIFTEKWLAAAFEEKTGLTYNTAGPGAFFDTTKEGKMIRTWVFEVTGVPQDVNTGDVKRAIAGTYWPILFRSNLGLVVDYDRIELFEANYQREPHYALDPIMIRSIEDLIQLVQ